MKLVLTIFLACSGLLANAQMEYNISIINDTVYNNKKAEFLIREMAKGNSKVFTLRNLEAKPLAMIYFSEKDSNIVCSARFPVQKKRYDVLYPKIDISVLMESYLRNKVIVNGAIDTSGLKAYCMERNIPLNNIEPRKISNPILNDSALAANAKADFESQIPFSIVNNAAKPQRFSIGTPSNNRTVIVAAGAKKDVRARVNDKVCLLNFDKSEKCTDVKKDLKSVTVSKELQLDVLHAD